MADRIARRMRWKCEDEREERRIRWEEVEGKRSQVSESSGSFSDCTGSQTHLDFSGVELGRHGDGSDGFDKERMIHSTKAGRSSKRSMALLVIRPGKSEIKSFMADALGSTLSLH